MSKPLRSLRLSPKSDYARFTGNRGEIFYDPVNNTLRVFNSTTVGGEIMATRSWVATQLPTVQGLASVSYVNQAVAAIPEYLLKITADDSTVLAVGRDETLQIRGTGGVTTTISTDSTGIQLVVDGFSGDYNDLANKPTNYVTAGILQGHTVSMHCERTSTGAIGQIMSFGNGTTLGKGLRMPAAGRLILATLAGTGINGELTVQAYLNGVANASYQLTQTNGSAGDVGVTGDFSSSPLLFSAGDTLGWYQASLPTASSAFNVNFYVSFDPPNFLT
jgi:hypothetical protein